MEEEKQSNVPKVKLGHFMLGIGADVFDDEDSNSSIFS
jgi:hypothetical protein